MRHRKRTRPPRLTPMPGHEPSWWLRARLADLATRHDTGTLPDCGHPAPRYVAALWRPVALCVDCLPAHRLSGVEDRTCDRCGAVTDDPMHVFLVGATPRLIVAGGLCEDCGRREVAA